jgi:hypothetical protein
MHLHSCMPEFECRASGEQQRATIDGNADGRKGIAGGVKDGGKPERRPPKYNRNAVQLRWTGCGPVAPVVSVTGNWWLVIQW